MLYIKARRERAGLTQAQLADSLGITKGAVGQWEIGVCNPKADQLPNIAAALGYTIDDLFRKEETA